MKSLLKSTRTFPIFDRIVEIRVEKFLQLTKNCNRVKLVGMEVAVENFLSSVNGISYNDDLRDVILRVGLVDAAPDGEQFHFSAYYKWTVLVRGLFIK